MVSPGTKTDLNYFDGSSPGCAWTGTPNLSTSTRPASGPWSRWTGTTETPLTESGVWDGSTVIPDDVYDVVTV